MERVHSHRMNQLQATQMKSWRVTREVSEQESLDSGRRPSVWPVETEISMMMLFEEKRVFADMLTDFSQISLSSFI